MCCVEKDLLVKVSEGGAFVYELFMWPDTVMITIK